jgi:integrase
MKPVRKQRLTELTVQKAKPEPGRYYLIWDSYQRGLALKVEPTGSKAWYCVYSRHGRARWLHLGNADAVSLERARMLTGKTLVAVAEGHDPAADRRAERNVGTFAELQARYLEHAKKHNKSWAQADALIRNHVSPRWGKLPVKTIVRSDVKALMAKISAPVAANQTLAAISAVFSWAVKEELVGGNPCRGVDRNPTRDRERVLAETEVPLFWRALDAVEPVQAGALKTVLLTGQRPGEVASMRREHIIDGWWEMPGAPVEGIWPGTKNGESNRVWLSRPVLQIIGEGATGFVFAGARGRPPGNLDKIMREISAKLGGEPLRPHDLRRTFGSRVTGLGFGRQAMDRILNHADNSVGSIYDRHSYAKEDRHIMESVGSRIMALVEGRVEGSKVVPFSR